jgi:putative intracellular protease/amidase
MRSVALAFALVLIAGSLARAQAPGDRPRVAILVYDGVQVLDHALPFEVFGQYGLNDVYTVAKDSTPLETFMGMRILPNHTFADAPQPDVLVVPGGDAGAAREDAEIRAWIRRQFAVADHVLGICSGVFFLTDAGLLSGPATTYYDLLDDLREEAPEVEVVEDEPVVASGKVLTSTGMGSLDASLRIVERLHGEGWARVIRLNKEYEPLPAEHHVPRARLADMNLPRSVYGRFAWRDADLVRYEGDRDAWEMAWRFDSTVPLDSLAASFGAGLREGDGRELAEQRERPTEWTSRWTLSGRDGEPWEGEVRLSVEAPGVYRLVADVSRTPGR